MADSALSALRSSARSISLDAISDTSIHLAGESYPLNMKCSFSSLGKTLTYSLISVFLLVQDPEVKVLQYKKICAKYKVEDSVKTLDKKAVLEYFLGGAVEEGSIEEKTEPQEDKEISSAVRKDKHKSNRKRSSREEDKNASSQPKKKEKTAITQQSIMDNLNIVVDKRGEKPLERDQGSSRNDVDSSGMIDSMESAKGDGEEEKERLAIQACLSAVGYEATEISKEALEKDRAEINDKITSFEIPVGNSASILRCGATATKTTSKHKSSSSSSSSAKKNFARVLDLYTESLKQQRRPSSKDPKRSRDGSTPKKVTRPTGKPIIIVPQAMTSPITLLNSLDFFQNTTFIPRDVMVKRMSGAKPTSVSIKREVSSHFGGGAIEYEIIDNPKQKLRSPKDWDRVVAVVAQGAAWQFKGWEMVRGRDANPVDVFSNAFGYYIGFEGAPIAQELRGWNVKRGFLSKDKRGLDTVVSASFWNGLDEWMSVHKRGYLPS